MKRNYTKDEIRELILDLSSENPEIAEFAMTALMMSNSRRHLNEIIRALEYDDDIIKERICFILGGFTENRCIDPLLSVLERNENLLIKMAAIDSLQYFYEDRIVPVLKYHLKSGPEEIKDAIIETLGEHIKHGVQNAHLPLIDIIKNDQEFIDLRLLALKKLFHLEAQELKPLIQVFKTISDASIYSQILLIEDHILEDKQRKLKEAKKLVNKLKKQYDSVESYKIEDELVSYGTTGARAIIDEVFNNPKNTFLFSHAGLVIEKLGIKAVPVLKSAFESFDKFHEFESTYLIQSLITYLCAPRYSALESSLLILLKNLNQYLRSEKTDDHKYMFSILKADLHLALAKYGSLKGMEDMKTLMNDGTKRQFQTLILAIRAIGDEDFLIPLINQYDAYRNSSDIQSLIRKAFLSIVKRLKIKRSDPLFDQLTDDQKLHLKEMTGK
jgi:hypothetical protein